MLKQRVHDQAHLHTALRLIRHRITDAVTAHLQTTDQSTEAGFVLTDVLCADGTSIHDRLTDDDWQRLAEDVEAHLWPTRWNSVVGENRHGDATLTVPPAATAPHRFQVTVQYTIAASVPVDAIHPEDALVTAIPPPLPDALPGGWQVTDDPAVATVADTHGHTVLIH